MAQIEKIRCEDTQITYFLSWFKCDGLSKNRWWKYHYRVCIWNSVWMVASNLLSGCSLPIFIVIYHRKVIDDKSLYEIKSEKIRRVICRLSSSKNMFLVQWYKRWFSFLQRLSPFFQVRIPYKKTKLRKENIQQKLTW